MTDIPSSPKKQDLDDARSLILHLRRRGWVIVPREPTEDMQKAGAFHHHQPVADIWRAMVEAAES